jgi:hypothetical protein
MTAEESVSRGPRSSILAREPAAASTIDRVVDETVCQSSRSDSDAFRKL